MTAPVVQALAPVTQAVSTVTSALAPVTHTAVTAPVTKAISTVTPLEQAVTPVTPVEQTLTPVTQTVTPVAQTVTPVAQMATPVTPVEQTAAPVEQTAAGVEQTVAPVVQAVAPVTPTLAPVAQTVAPVTPALAPVTQAVGLADSAPVMRAVAPVTHVSPWAGLATQLPARMSNLNPSLLPIPRPTFLAAGSRRQRSVVLAHFRARFLGADSERCAVWGRCFFRCRCRFGRLLLWCRGAACAGDALCATCELDASDVREVAGVGAVCPVARAPWLTPESVSQVLAAGSLSPGASLSS